MNYSDTDNKNFHLVLYVCLIFYYVMKVIINLGAKVALMAVLNFFYTLSYTRKVTIKTFLYYFLECFVSDC